MKEKFEGVSKQMARRHSRRGVIRLAGAGLLGATAAAVLPAAASADGQFTRPTGLWFTNVNGQNFNVMGPIRIRVKKLEPCVDCD